MSSTGYSLAIETSGRLGGVSLGRGEKLLDSIELPEQRRHAMDLMPAIDRLFSRQGAAPKELSQIFVSVGPGSFTGLRIGTTTAKVLAQVTFATLVAVPTMAVVVENAPDEVARAAVCLNAKRGQCYTQLFERDAAGWEPGFEPCLLTPAQLVDRGPSAFAVIGDRLPDYDWPPGVDILEAERAVARSDVLWRLGRARADRGESCTVHELVPLYVRLPEAEELWQARAGEQAGSAARPGGD